MPTSQKPFIKLHHQTPLLLELLKHPNEWVLYSLIACRASRKGNIIKGLQSRQALIGDYKNCGLTEQKYRTAKKNLEKWSIATFQPTTKGTIATLCNEEIYDINSEQTNGQPTDSQQTGNERVTTNKNIKKEKKGKKGKNISPQTPQGGETDKPADTIKNFKQWSEDTFSGMAYYFKKDYSQDIINQFINYWTEKNTNGKMRFQLQKTWDTGKRLARWQINSGKFDWKRNKTQGQNKTYKPEDYKEGF